MNNERYVPGSEWVTYKLYTNVQSAEELLLNKVYPVVKRLLAEGLISQFFFIRYSDPAFHLRVRVKVSAPECLGPTLETFVPVLVKCFRRKLIDNVLLESYVPENERYGAATMELSEQLFCIDSHSVVELLRLLRARGDSDRHRWLVSMMMVRDTLECFFDDAQTRANVMSMLAAAFKREHGFVNKRYTKQLNDKYRNYNSLIAGVLAGDNAETRCYARALTRRKRALRRLAADNAALIEANRRQWEANFSSIMHMSMNRLFKSRNRQFEMVIYEFMSKYQASQLARMKYGPGKAAATRGGEPQQPKA